MVKEHRFAVMQSQQSIWVGIKETFKNKTFYYVAILSFSLSLLMTSITTGVYYYADYIMQINIDALRSNWVFIIYCILLLAITIISIFGLVHYISKIGPRKIAIISYASATIGFVLFFITGLNFYNNIIAFGFIAVGAAGGMIILPPINGDIIDYDETLTGKRREGTYGGVLSLATKPAVSIANWAFLGILALFGFQIPLVSNGVTTYLPQTHMALIGILFGISILPGAFTFICLIVMIFYPLDGPEWRKKKLELKALHEEKTKEYLASLQNSSNDSDSKSLIFPCISYIFFWICFL